MKAIIFRNKQTNKIEHYNDYLKRYDNEVNKFIVKYNNDVNNTRYAEVVELDEISEFFYNVKAVSKKDYFAGLRYIQDLISELSSLIDDRLDKLDKLKD